MIQGVKTCIDENGRVVLDACIDEDGRGHVIPCGETCSFMPWQTVNLPASEPCGGEDYDVTTEMPFVRGASWRGIFAEMLGRFSEHDYRIFSDRASLLSFALGENNNADIGCYLWATAAASSISLTPGTGSDVIKHRIQNRTFSIDSNLTLTECVELDSIVGIYSGAVGKVYTSPPDSCCVQNCEDGIQTAYYGFSADLPLWRGAGGKTIKLSLSGTSSGRGAISAYRWDAVGIWRPIASVEIWRVEHESCEQDDISGEYALAIPGDFPEVLVVFQQRTVNNYYGGSGFFIEDVRYE